MTLLTLTVSAQKVDKKEVGIRFLYGFENEILPEGKVYKPVMILPYYNHYFTKADKRARLSGMLEQQITLAIDDYQDTNKKDFDWEFGLNAGPVFSYRFNWFTPYIGGEYGANYITVETKHQDNGIIFTATALSGIKKEFKNNVYGDAHLRFRHISNGGMNPPNLGIDTWFAGIGISKLY